MVWAEVNKTIRGLITGEKQISASSPDIEYTPGMPRRVTTSSLRDNITKVTIEQRGKRQFTNFRGDVQVQTSLNGETIAVEGTRINEQGDSDGDGVHIWWGGRHQLVGTRLFYDPPIEIELKFVDLRGENVTFLKKKKFIVPDKSYYKRNLRKTRFSYPPPRIELVELGQDGGERVLESNEKEIEGKWEEAEQILEENRTRNQWNDMIGYRLNQRGLL